MNKPEPAKPAASAPKPAGPAATSHPPAKPPQAQPPKPQSDDDDNDKDEAEELLDAVEAQSLSGDQQAAMNKLRKFLTKKK